MQVTHYFTASLTAPAPAALYAVKGDGARMAVARLMAGAEPWTAPEGVTAGISYTLPDKTPGYYDRLEDGTPACMIAGNLVSAVLAPVLTGQAGAVKVSIVLRDADGGQVATFPIQLRVEQAPGIVDAEGVPAMGSGFEGKLFYGGPGGALTALGLGGGVRVEVREDGTLALVAEGGSGGGGGIDEEEDPTVPAWAKQPQKPTYTAEEVGALPKDTKIPGKTSELTNDAGFVNKAVNDLANYYTKVQTQELIAAIPRFRVTVVQQLPAAGEDLVLYLVPFATAEGQYLEYLWVDGRWEIIGSQRVDLTGYATEVWVKDYVEEHSGQNVTIDTTLTQSGKAADAKAVGDALGELEKKIPSIEGLAKEEDIPTKPEDIGAQPAGNYLTKAPVESVNGKTGAVQLGAADVGARPDNWMPTAQEVGALPDTYTPPNQTADQVGADPKGTADTAVSTHNTNNEAHPDIRLEIKAIREQLAAFLDVDDETLNELSELIAAIAANQTSIEQLTAGKVSVGDIVNDLTTNVANKPLSAAQGVVIKTLLDGLSTGKLDASALQSSISTALAQAKASGEFDGKNGDPGDPGRGIKSNARTSGNGAAGTVDTYTITYTDGTTSTYQVRNGGNGKDGYTPVKGVDYYTDAEQDALKAEIIEEINSSSGGGTTEVFTDVLAEVGYTNKMRINSSGGIVAWDSADKPADVTGYIPVAPGDKIKMKDIIMPSAFTSGAYWNSAGAYTAAKAFIAKINLCYDDKGVSEAIELTVENDNVVGFTVAASQFGENVAYIVINAKDITDSSEVYVNSTIVRDTGEVPAYWAAEMAQKAEAIQQAVETAGRNGTGFLWYTDAHWEDNAKVSPVLLRYLRKHTPLRRVKFGGDVVCDPAVFNHASISYVYDWMAATADLEQDAVPGNHDYNHHSTDVSAMTYAFILAPHKKANMVVGDGLYYYIDEPCERTRYLHLDYLTSDHAAMTAQGEFIVDALKSMPERWHIIAIAHRWFQYTSSAAPTVGSVPNYEKEILKIFDEYNARGNHTASNYFDTQSFADGKGKVEFCIGGHIHVDYDFATDGGIPIILTASDTNQDRSADETEDSGTVGTTTESAVYGIIADYGNNKITVVGVGRGGSRVIALG